MFPVSGAEQLKTSGATGLRPMTSHNGAYSRFVNPAPFSSSGRKRFHNPAVRAFGFNSSMIDRKSTRLNSSHGYISYAVFCLKKKKKSTVINFQKQKITIDILITTERDII